MITTISDKKVLDTFSRQIFFLGVPANNEELGIKLRTFTNDYDLGFKNDTTKVIKLYGYQEILPLISNDSILYVPTEFDTKCCFHTSYYNFFSNSINASYSTLTNHQQHFTPSPREQELKTTVDTLFGKTCKNTLFSQEPIFKDYFFSNTDFVSKLYLSSHLWEYKAIYQFACYSLDIFLIPFFSLKFSCWCFFLRIAHRSKKKRKIDYPHVFDDKIPLKSWKDLTVTSVNKK